MAKGRQKVNSLEWLEIAGKIKGGTRKFTAAGAEDTEK